MGEVGLNIVSDWVLQLIGMGGLLIAIIRSMGSLNINLINTLNKTIAERNIADEKRIEEKEARLKETEARLLLESQLIKMQSEQSDQLKKIEVLEKDRDGYKEVLNNWESRINALEQERDSLKKQVAGLLEEKETDTKLRNDLEKRIDSLENQVDALLIEREQLIGERNSLKEKLGIAETELAKRVEVLEKANEDKATDTQNINPALVLTAPDSIIKSQGEST